mmetsp:Transcript_24038/g.49120  ORF Transcript_24038/g.49120 Transcript_24038/m.49120 type:complete len:216 (-) Transcript_24038:1222-1869(-)
MTGITPFHVAIFVVTTLIVLGIVFIVSFRFLSREVTPICGTGVAFGLVGSRGDCHGGYLQKCFSGFSALVNQFHQSRSQRQFGEMETTNVVFKCLKLHFSFWIDGRSLRRVFGHVRFLAIGICRGNRRKFARCGPKHVIGKLQKRAFLQAIPADGIPFQIDGEPTDFPQVEQQVPQCTPQFFPFHCPAPGHVEIIREDQTLQIHDGRRSGFGLAE